MSTTRKSGFKVNLGEWEQPNVPEYALPQGGYKRLRDRPWQQKCFNKLRTAPYWIVTAPMAAGKTLLICALAYEKMRRDKNLRVIISVPQTLIADGFEKENFETSSGKKVDWVASHNNLCRTNRSPLHGSTIAHVLDWLGQPTGVDTEARVLLCCHQTLVAAFAENKDLFQRALVVIDEAHHAMCGTNDEEGLRIHNGLGAVVRYAADTERIQLGLTTATLFRSDALNIVPDHHVTKFTRFNLKFHEFLEAVKPFEHFSYDFALYEASWQVALEGMFDKRVGKTIVYIPGVNTSTSLGDKFHDVNTVLQAIAGVEKPIIQDRDESVMRVRRGDKWIKVVDLVDPVGRDRKKMAIFNAQNECRKDDIDVIIALGMFREGANWEWADREIIIGPRNSLVDVLQTIGRLFRKPRLKAHAKKKVEVIHLLSKGVTKVDEEEKGVEIKENLNDYLKSVFASMLLEEIFNPVRLCEKNSKGGKDGGKEKASLNLIGIFDSEIETYRDFEDRVYRSFMAWQSQNGNGTAPLATARLIFDGIIEEELKDEDVSALPSEVADLVWAHWARKTLQMRGLDPSEIDLDLIDEVPTGFLMNYTSGLYGIKRIRDLQEKLVKFAFVSFEECRNYARSLGLKSAKQWREHVKMLNDKGLM